MSREIKFRVWCETDEGMEMIHLGKTECDNGLWFDAPKHIDGYTDSIMQFTGLKDKNGKDIYEGDILEFPYEMGIAFVINDGFRFAVESPGSQAVDYENREVFESSKIIGNIHENPEFLQ